jgi:hypothetical protein
VSAAERVLRRLMRRQKVKGKARDYVALAGGRLLDCSGEYLVERIGDAVVTRLVHKRELHRYVPAEVAACFWSRSLRMRVRSKVLAKCRE